MGTATMKKSQKKELIQRPEGADPRLGMALISQWVLHAYRDLSPWWRSHAFDVL